MGSCHMQCIWSFLSIHALILDCFTGRKTSIINIFTDNRSTNLLSVLGDSNLQKDRGVLLPSPKLLIPVSQVDGASNLYASV